MFGEVMASHGGVRDSKRPLNGHSSLLPERRKTSVDFAEVDPAIKKNIKKHVLDLDM